MEGEGAASPSAKRPRNDGESGTDEFGRSRGTKTSTALVAVPAGTSTALTIPSTDGTLPAGPVRTSSLDAPIMVLEGHGSAVTGLAFDPTGRVLATSSKDKTVFLWAINGSCTNTAVLRGHKNAVLDVDFLLGGEQLATAGADKDCAVWDAASATRVRKLVGHSKIVNAVSGSKRGSPLIASASDDGSVIIWDARRRGPVHTLRQESAGGVAFPVLSVAFGSSASDTVFSAGIDNVIKQWDLRKGSKTSAGLFSSSPAMLLPGHSDSVTGLALHPQGTHLASFSADHTLRTWDVRPYCASPSRCTRALQGATQNFEQQLIRPAWSPDGERLACGSADRRVWVWDYESGRVEYCLPGHAGVVTAVTFSPTDPAVLASAGADRKVYLGELYLPEAAAAGSARAAASSSSSSSAAASYGAGAGAGAGAGSAAGGSAGGRGGDDYEEAAPGTGMEGDE